MALDEARGVLKRRRKLYQGKIVDLIVDDIELDGRSYVREVVRHPGGVVIVGRNDEGRIPFVRQHRYPMHQELLELPAGKIDAGEEPLSSAARELEEETGYRAGRLDLVYRFYSSPGFCDELLHLYFASGLERRATRLEQDEIVELEEYPLQEALELVEKGDIRDAKTIVALLWMARKGT